MFVLPVPREYVAQNSKLRIAIVYLFRTTRRRRLTRLSRLTTGKSQSEHWQTAREPGKITVGDRHNLGALCQVIYLRSTTVDLLLASST